MRKSKPSRRSVLMVNPQTGRFKFVTKISEALAYQAEGWRALMMGASA